MFLTFKQEFTYLIIDLSTKPFIVNWILEILKNKFFLNDQNLKHKSV